jgi:hypothetical protein
MALDLRATLARLRPRRLTTSEIAERDAEQHARAHMRQQKSRLRVEADHYARIIAGTLEDLNICYRYKKSESDFLTSRVKRISFRRPYVLREEAIYLEVDLRPGKRPRGVGVKELSDTDKLDNLSINCGHKVLCRYTAESGFWYVVEREYGVRGIPSHVKYDAMLEARPASADGLSLPLGIGENKRPVYRSLGQMYSMLIAGTIGGGKSNVLNVMICTLMRYNSPNRLKFVLIDLKGGVEFSFFSAIPHLLQLPNGVDYAGEKIHKPALIERRDDVPDAFRWLILEGERRMERLKAERAKSIGQFNFRNQRHGMPHIVVVIDEWADVKLDRKLGSEAEEMLINIASRFRAVGIHIILCTQVPNKDVVSIRVKNVLPAKFAFACPDVHASILILGDGSAHGLSPAGRGIFDWGGRRHELQTPYINNDTVDSIVAQAVAGKFNDVQTATHDVTDQEIFEWALTENGGHLDYRGVFNRFRIRGITEVIIKDMLASYENQKVVIGASVYLIVPGGPGKARRLLADEGDQATDESTVEVAA